MRNEVTGTHSDSASHPSHTASRRRLPHRLDYPIPSIIDAPRPFLYVDTHSRLPDPISPIILTQFVPSLSRRPTFSTRADAAYYILFLSSWLATSVLYLATSARCVATPTRIYIACISYSTAINLYPTRSTLAPRVQLDRAGPSLSLFLALRLIVFAVVVTLVVHRRRSAHVHRRPRSTPTSPSQFPYPASLPSRTPGGLVPLHPHTVGDGE